MPRDATQSIHHLHKHGYAQPHVKTTWRMPAQNHVHVLDDKPYLSLVYIRKPINQQTTQDRVIAVKLTSWKLNMKITVLRCNAALSGTDLSFGLPTLSIFRVLQSWKWRQYVPPKHSFHYIRLNNVTSQKTVIFSRNLYILTPCITYILLPTCYSHIHQYISLSFTLHFRYMFRHSYTLILKYWFPCISLWY